MYKLLIILVTAIFIAGCSAINNSDEKIDSLDIELQSSEPKNWLRENNNAFWEYVSTYDDSSQVFLDIASVNLDKNEFGDVIFHATFKTEYSSEGVANCVENFSDPAWGVSESRLRNISHELFACYFKSVNGTKYISINRTTIFEKNGAIIEEISDDNSESFYWKEIDAEPFITWYYMAFSHLGI